MIIDVADLSGSPKHFDAKIPAGEIELDADHIRLLADVKMVGDVLPSEREVKVKGRVEYRAEVDCTRCLNPVERAASTEFDINYVWPEDFASGKAIEVEAADLETDVLENGRVDLKKIAREQLLLDMPEQIFCKEDCKGLCPKCGADRNLINCDCDETEIDPRWAALRDLQ